MTVPVRETAKDMKDLIHRRLVAKKKEVDDWFAIQSEGLDFPIYSSFDIRDAGIKLASVDANIFPAGFNNICDVDQEQAVDHFKNYLDSHYGSRWRRILLLTEEHTSNRYYWENVFTLADLITQAGSEVRVAVPKEFDGVFKVSTPKGRTVDVYSARRQGAGVVAEGFEPDLIVSNNDFSNPYSEWFAGLKVPINPSRELGWFRRRKSDHFMHYNRLATELSRLIDVNPWTFTVETEVMKVDFSDPGTWHDLAQAAQKFIDRLSEGYRESKRPCEDPTIFIKNNSGTYGLGILSVRSGEELLKLNSREQKKMGYAKGGDSVHEVILQEGIPTRVTADGDTAEPAIYMVGRELAGGFMRSHKEKGVTENLNSPGAVFKRLCMSDLIVDVEGARLENVYGWIAKLNMLAIGHEGKAVGAAYKFA